MGRLFYQEIQDPPAVERLFAAVAAEENPFFLDSSLAGGRLGRFSFLGSRPAAVLTARGREVTIQRGNKVDYPEGSPLDALRALLQKCPLEVEGDDAPFPGGAVGYFGYDLGHHFERLPCTTEDDVGFPDMYFGLYDFVVTCDHEKERAFATAVNVADMPEAEFVENAKRRLGELLEAAARESAPTPPAGAPGKAAGSFTRGDYLAAVERAKEYIAAGDIYQVNLSQRFGAPVRREPAALYRVLRGINPAPFSAFLSFGDMAVLSSSPERFMRLRGRHAETRPIKGTRPRREGDVEFNRRMRAELLSSEKDAAELAMIVDLERNDLGRVAEFGSVAVTEHRVIEEYPTVCHLVATVEADLRADADALDLIAASFPGGSVTGAPKIRAMEIIDELEPTRRGVYTGSIGYVAFDGNMDTNIVIRTILVRGDRAYFQVGGGIVADSDPAAEYQETLDKGLALFRALA